MVGTTGFEPATSRTPSVRATRLRHVPTASTALGPLSSVSLAFEEGQDREELFVEIEQEFSMRARRRAMLRRNDRYRDSFTLGLIARRRRDTAALFGKVLSRARDRETLFVKEPLDLEDGLDVLAAVEAVPARAFHRLECGEFRLPVAQNECLGGRQAAHFPDTEKALFRDFPRSMGRTCHVLSVS